ncbi:glycolate oxidase, subunit GlcD [Cladophialophora immunda]|uniref:D-lactate dehydrogenase (cytochrome) n=1 Tax=Cladophialophora immunda TaxID=569365 RepID=A0A0D2A427_9EURO|nr:glycolate oxidase, subunit GlcD [Cladophialophora immunda]KIW35026.1 glycolate oxidase, subunit GlcD [Cladophialophora immunda]OQV09826.1 FAD linked oxidase, domain-containing protein [Cladophialophora immunda]
MKSIARLSRPVGSLLRCAERERSSCFTPWATRSFHSSPTKLEEKGKGDAKENLSFRGQLYQSTADRLKRERASEEQYIRAATTRGGGAGGRTLSLSFVILSVAAAAYYLGKRGERPLDASSTTPLSRAHPPQHDTRTSNLQAAWVDFAQIVGKDNVSTIPDDLEAHSGSEWSSYATKPNERPFAIVYPATTEEVSKIMKVCHERRIPVTALSGGTSLEGHFAPTRGGICIDMARMDKILELRPQDLDIVVQPALGWEDLNEELKGHGMFFPPDPGPGAKIGGMVGTGCSGTNAYRYGTMRDWVVSLTVVLADGTIIKTRRRPRKSSAGYNLTQMFIGSEGTLGIVTEATLKITVLPKSQSVAVATFPTIHAAAECVARVVGEGIQLAGMEILDDVQMRCINKSGMTSRPWQEAPTLFFKFAGTTEGVKEQIKIIRNIAKGTHNQSFEFAKNDDEAAELWSARKEALWSVMAMRKNSSDHVWTTDVAVPISRLADIIQETHDDVAKSGLIGGICGHVGDGNFHTILLYNDTEKKIAEELVHRMIRRAIAMEGTVTGEHGVGLKKREYLREELGDETVDAMRKLKQAFDPLGLLNCDKIVQIEAGH